MTTQTLLLDLFDYGSSPVTVTVHNPDTLVLTDTADTVTKNVVNGCRYVAVFTRDSVLAAGVYAVGIEVNGIPGLLYCTLTGVDGETAIARAERPSLATVEAKVDSIYSCVSSTTITTTGLAALDGDGNLLLKRGHTATITFTSDTNNIVSDLSPANTKVFFGIRDTGGRYWMQVEGTVVTATGLQSVRFTLPADKAKGMIAGYHLFDVIAVYGYNANNTPKYTSMEPFTSGNVRVLEVGVELDLDLVS